MFLEEVGVLTAEMRHGGFLWGRGLLAAGWKEACRQPCASCQFLEVHLCRELLAADHALPGHMPLVPSGDVEY